MRRSTWPSLLAPALFLGRNKKSGARVTKAGMMMILMPEAREKQKQKTKKSHVGGGGIMCVISVIYLFIAPAACLPQPQTLFKKVSCGYGGLNGCLNVRRQLLTIQWGSWQNVKMKSSWKSTAIIRGKLLQLFFSFSETLGIFCQTFFPSLPITISFFLVFSLTWHLSSR